MDEKTTLLTFPCQFPIKIVGLASEEFEKAVYQVIHTHVPNLTKGALQNRLSKDAKYLAITANIEATSQAQLDAIYTDLGKVPGLVMCL